MKSLAALKDQIMKKDDDSADEEWWITDDGDDDAIDNNYCNDDTQFVALLCEKKLSTE